MRLALKLFSVLFFGCLLIFLFSTFSKSKTSPTTPTLTRPVVTVINPIRGPQLGLEQVHLLDSLKSQWQVTKNAGVKATWLWQYSAMEDTTLVEYAKAQMKDQEFGLFLETDRNSSAKSDVLYRGRGPWYFSDGLFLLSYDQGERRKLVDATFKKFKNTFGYYPKTVGAWWVGADSLQYMREKYGIVATLQVADQYDLDVYSVWGQPWSIPYISSKENAAVPAPAFDNSSGVVVMQWAPRDPTYGYGSSSAASTFSMQDYSLKNYDLSYVDYLLSIFLKGSGDQVIMGLESGSDPKGYSGEYKNKLLKIRDLQKKHTIDVLTAGKFAEGFLARKQVFGTSTYFLSTGYASHDQSFWYQSKTYRAGILKQGENIFLVDVRDYLNAGNEDFDLLPNSQGYLRIAAPAIVDSARNESQKILIGRSNNDLRVKKENDTIIVTDGHKEIAKFTENSIITNLKTFVFQEHKRPLNVFILLFSALLLYTLILLMIQKNKHSVFLISALLLFCLLVMHSFLSRGNFFDSTILLDQKTLFLLPLLHFIPFDPLVELLIVFQITPFLILLFVTYLFLIKKNLSPLFAITVFLFLLLYSHVPSFIVTEFITKKKIAVIGAIGLYVVFMLFTCGFLWFKKKKGIWLQMLIVLFAGLIIVCSTVILSWQKLAIVPFEMKSLQFITASQKNVYFVMPKEMPVYRAVEPLLVKNYKYGESLTGVTWQEVKRPEGKILTFDNLTNSVIFVPRYLGADLYPEEITKYGLKKIFDNTQIQIYSF